MKSHLVVFVDLDYTSSMLTQLERLGATFDIVGRRRYAQTIAPHLIDQGTWFEESNFDVPHLTQAVHDVAERRQCTPQEIRLVSLREKSIEIMSAVARLTGCIGVSERAALLFRDKWEMVRRAEKIGVPVPRSTLGKDWQSWLDSFPDLGVFMKPRRGSQSVGIAHYASARALCDAMAQHEALSELLLQEYIAGSVYFVDAVRLDGRNVACCVGKHLVPLAEAGRSPHRYVSAWATDASGSDFLELLQMHNRIAEDFGAPDGCTHMEFLMRNGRPLLCEAAIRPPGLRVLPLQEAVWGWTAPELQAAHLCGARLMPIANTTRPFAGLIDFTPEGPVRWHTPVQELVDSDVISAVTWPASEVRGGDYTQPLARLVFRKASAQDCEAMLTRLTREFSYDLVNPA